MKKQVTICFRTSEELRSALEEVARGDRRSLSSAIELILTDYAKRNGVFSASEERRRFARKPVSIPAFVKRTQPGPQTRQSAVILDLSLNGMRLSLPKDAVAAVPDKNDLFETSFALPDRSEPITVVCRPERVLPVNGNVHVGASFVDADFHNYRDLQQYLT